MENASKALIIAGAILLSILIIAIGMYIYNSSTSSVYAAGDQIAAQDLEAFNSEWTNFENTQSGTTIKNMIGKLITNAQKNEAEKIRLPDLAFVASDGGDMQLVTSNVNENNVIGFNSARTQLESKHNYYVEIHYSTDSGLVDMITVHYEKPASIPTMEEDSYDDVPGVRGVQSYSGNTGKGGQPSPV